MSLQKSIGTRKRPAQQLSVEQVCERIRSAIMRGELKPGAKLTEQDLAAELEVSRTPIREAIRQLEAERLVTRVPFVGVTVSQPSAEEVLELLEIREVLEGLVARLATRHMDDAHLKRLRASQKKLAECARRADVAAYLDHALAFRRALVECCRSESLAENVLVIENRLRLVGNRTALLPGRMEASITEHENLLEAIERGDASRAEQLNRERIQHIRDAFARSMAFTFV
jgi:DNA-binding GntR family transcriptional regulator